MSTIHLLRDRPYPLYCTARTVVSMCPLTYSFSVSRRLGPFITAPTMIHSALQPFDAKKSLSYIH